MSMQEYERRLAEKAAQKLARRAEWARYLLLAKKYLGWVPGFIVKKVRDRRTKQKALPPAATPSASSTTPAKPRRRFTKTKVSLSIGAILSLILTLYKWGSAMLSMIKLSHPSAPPAVTIPDRVSATTAAIVIGIVVLGLVALIVAAISSSRRTKRQAKRSLVTSTKTEEKRDWKKYGRRTVDKVKAFSWGGFWWKAAGFFLFLIVLASWWSISLWPLGAAFAQFRPTENTPSVRMVETRTELITLGKEEPTITHEWTEIRIVPGTRINIETHEKVGYEVGTRLHEWEEWRERVHSILPDHAFCGEDWEPSSSARIRVVSGEKEAVKFTITHVPYKDDPCAEYKKPIPPVPSIRTDELPQILHELNSKETLIEKALVPEDERLLACFSFQILFWKRIGRSRLNTQGVQDKANETES